MTKIIYTLAIDTANDSISVALLKNKDVLSHDFRIMNRGQGEALIPMIQSVLKEASFDIQKLDRVAVSIGPGSFTGVRIGLSAARGVGLALNIPIYGVTSFEAAAYQSAGFVLAVLDTKRGDFYTQLFQDGKEAEGPTIRTVGQISSLDVPVLIGAGAQSLANQTKKEIRLYPMEPAIAVGLCSFQKTYPPEPLYLRDADVSL